MSVLLVERDATIAVLTMNRPDALNALSLELEGALKDAFRGVDAPSTSDAPTRSAGWSKSPAF